MLTFAKSLLIKLLFLKTTSWPGSPLLIKTTSTSVLWFLKILLVITAPVALKALIALLVSPVFPSKTQLFINGEEPKDISKMAVILPIAVLLINSHCSKVMRAPEVSPLISPTASGCEPSA